MNQAVQATTVAHPSFELVRNTYIDALKLEVQEYRHRSTGAAHYHLGAQNSENVFLVALRTVPHDSTGVAHILEHTALCGSEHYPVRDPFFMMLRRSLNTFMNAFTSSDWTAYPFASQNRKDFNNLLDVYLDAVFFSRLDPLDFAQEGHRVEFAEPDNPESDLVFKGVVFNEMKGAMSSVNSVLWDTLCRHLLPSTTYHYNSGGDPAHIPDLSYAQLCDFYRSHYHPSNAIFMTFGDIPAAEHQARFEERALHRFDPLSERIQVEREQPFTAPIQIHDCYAFDDPGSDERKTHIVMAWVVGESTDLLQTLEAQLLSSVLLDNSASPLQHALETTSLGQAPSPMCGLEDSMRELVFCCGIEGTEGESREDLEALVMDTLRSVASKGVPHEDLEAVLHQLELHQREISGDSYPYGLQLILTSLGAATHYADPIALLNLEPVIADLRAKITDPNYICELAQRLLVDNQHRLTLVLSPDRELSQQRLATEQTRLAAMKNQMDAGDRDATVKLAADLLQRQGQVDDEDVLPRVELSDVPASLPELEMQGGLATGRHCTWYRQGTNGLAYRQAIAAVPELAPEEEALLPLYSSVLTELGLGNEDYMAVQRRQAASVGSINAFHSFRGQVNDEQALNAYFILSSKALANRHTGQAGLMRDTLQGLRFDEHARLQELVSQQRARREQSVTGNGHGLAMAAACAGMSPLARLNHQLSGLAGLREIRQLDEQLAGAESRATFADSLSVLHQRVMANQFQFLCIAESEHIEDIVSVTEQQLGSLGGNADASHFNPAAVREQRKELWTCNTQVNFCARAYPTVPMGHTDSPALTVLGGFLRNGFLHRAIREQGGAYGGGASQDSSVAAFRFYSYRDPRLEETLEDFDASVRWLLDSQHSDRALEEAILGVVGSLDKPSSPAGEAKQHFHNNLFGRSHAMREQFRQQILQVSLGDLRRVAETYLEPARASTAVIAPTAVDSDRLCADLNLELQAL